MEHTNECCAAKVDESPVMLSRPPQNISGLDVTVCVPHVMHVLHRTHDMHERLEDSDEVSHVGACKLVQALPLLDYNAWGEYVAPQTLRAISIFHNSERGRHQPLEDGAFIEVCLTPERLHSMLSQVLSCSRSDSTPQANHAAAIRDCEATCNNVTEGTFLWL
jgi:hypothetical protein